MYNYLVYLRAWACLLCWSLPSQRSQVCLEFGTEISVSQILDRFSSSSNLKCHSVHALYPSQPLMADWGCSLAPKVGSSSLAYRLDCLGPPTLDRYFSDITTLAHSLACLSSYEPLGKDSCIRVNGQALCRS